MVNFFKPATFKFWTSYLHRQQNAGARKSEDRVADSDGIKVFDDVDPSAGDAVHVGFFRHFEAKQAANLT
jgi:hypothetical protein